MVPSRPTEQRKATAAAPRAGSGQHSSPSSPSSGAARASAGEALVWHFVCDEICDVLCEVLSADDVDDVMKPILATQGCANNIGMRGGCGWSRV